MQTIHSILAIASILSMTMAAPAEAAAAAAPAPLGLIKAFTLPDCAELSGAGGVVAARNVDLPEGECTNINPAFSSLEGAIQVACPKGTTAMVTAYPDLNCLGDGTSAGVLPENMSVGECKETVIESSSGSVSAGSQSAEFTCV